MKNRKKTISFHPVCTAGLLCAPPLLGVSVLDAPVAPYLEFPPTTRYVEHAPFQWPVFLPLLLFIAAACLPFLYRLLTTASDHGKRTAAAGNPFPWWGRLGTAAVLIFWVLAWNRFSFFEPLQRYTFFPLWGGYILAVNGLTARRQGSCLLRSRPVFFLALFPASSLFWWYFEYLNRFVQNWYYLGGAEISATEYVIHASVCFSTVLPAVLSTSEFLGTSTRLERAFGKWHKITVGRKQGLGRLLLAFSASALAGLAVFPEALFPLVWVAPLLLLVGDQLAAGRPTIFAGVEKGDWRQVVLPALAALLCGFFWEMWNWKSLARWEYSVPFVHRFQIFAMPLLGYAGYLPFGLECAAAATLLDRVTGTAKSPHFPSL